MATRDYLTGLPNRLLLIDRLKTSLARALREEEMLGLMFIDLDGFKSINDTLGHEAGDRLLQVVANRLKEAVRQSDTVARLGGDEFVVLLPTATTRDGMTIVGRKILDSISNPAELGNGHTAQVGCSIGAVCAPDHADSFEDLLRLADETMYRVKRRGKNAFLFIDEGD